MAEKSLRNENNGKANGHLTRKMRNEIQDCLMHGMDFKHIARQIGKDATTVSREIKRHIVVLPARSAAEKEKPCEQLKKVPFVCNGCLRRNKCLKERHCYYATKADEDYRSLLSDSRSGLALNREDFYRNDDILKTGVKKGQHIYHIIHSNNLSVSQASVYRYIKKGYSAVSLLDLPRAAKFKPRKAKPVDHIPATVKRGRTYDCFTDFITAHEIEHWVEMDTVIGRLGGKVLLTFSLSNVPFMFSRLCDDKSALSVSAEIIQIKKALASAGFSFGTLFPVVLTDNGGEFSNVSAVEKSITGVFETNLFFCDPYSSFEKPHVEKGHTLLRDILPKGTSFDSLTQEKVNIIFSHINAVARKELNGKSAYDAFTFLYGGSLASALGISFIPPDDVNQSPSLLK